MLLEIFPAAREAAEDVASRHVVAALFHPSGDTTQRKLRRRDPQLDDFDPPSGGKRRQFRSQRREPAGDQIRIDEMDYTRLFGQELTRKGGLSCSVRSCNDDAAWR